MEVPRPAVPLDSLLLLPILVSYCKALSLIVWRFRDERSLQAVDGLDIASDTDFCRPTELVWRLVIVTSVIFTTQFWLF